jgi:hypothetical protein
MIKKILYWIMVVVIVGGAVYSYQKVNFGRGLGMLYQLASGNASSMGGPGGGSPPNGGGQQPGGGPGGTQGGTQKQPPMGQNVQGGRPDFQQGGRQGGPPGGNGQGPGGSWYKISVRNIIPYTFILAFFVLITCVIERTVKRVFYSKT